MDRSGASEYSLSSGTGLPVEGFEQPALCEALEVNPEHMGKLVSPKGRRRAWKDEMEADARAGDRSHYLEAIWEREGSDWGTDVIPVQQPPSPTQRPTRPRKSPPHRGGC